MSCYWEKTQVKHTLIIVLIAAFSLVWPYGATAGTDPASAFPGDTLFYMEITEPAAGLDLLSRTDFWPQAEAMFTELAGAVDGRMDNMSALFRAMAEWRSDPDLRRSLEVLAGETLAMGVLPSPGKGMPTVVVAARGCRQGDQIEALTFIASRLFTNMELRACVASSGIGFSIEDGTGRIMLAGRKKDQWLVFSTSPILDSAEGIVSALRSGTPIRSDSLSKREDFQWAMASLPETPWARAYVNAQGALDWIKSRVGADSPFFRVARATFSRTGAVGLARELDLLSHLVPV